MARARVDAGARIMATPPIRSTHPPPPTSLPIPAFPSPPTHLREQAFRVGPKAIEQLLRAPLYMAQQRRHRSWGKVDEVDHLRDL